MSSTKKTRARVVVTGLGIVTSNARNTAEFVRSLIGGVSGIKSVHAFDVQDYCNKTAGEIDNAALDDGEISPECDRAIRMALISAKEAVTDSGLNFQGELGKRSAVTMGSSLGGWTSYLNGFRKECQENPGAEFADAVAPLLDVPPCRIAAYICKHFGISGGHMAAVTACAAGANSIALGIDLIRRGTRDVVLTAATDPLCEISFSGFNILMAMASSVSKPFDRNREGLLVGEGAGTLVLESLDHALDRNARIYEIPGYGLSNDAYHATQPDPEAGGACRAISRALSDAAIHPSEVDYINAHGTSTKYNDLMELRAIQKIYGEDAHNIPISSIKSMIGHTLGAAGMVEAIATVLAMHHRFLPPTLNFTDPIDGFDYDFIPHSRPAERAEVMSSHSFGFGGNAACILFRKHSSQPGGVDPTVAQAAFQ